MAMKLARYKLNEAGLIFGASATQGGLNVQRRLAAFREMYQFDGQLAADLGCGRAPYTYELARHFARVIGVDILPENIAAARKRATSAPGDVEFECASLESIPMRTDSVDAAFLIEVLDHVPSVAACLKETLRVLRPGGKCYVSVPNLMFPFETHPVRLWGRMCHPIWFPFLPWVRPIHLRVATARVFRWKDLRLTCEQAGFRPLKRSFILPPLELHGGKLLQALSAKLERTPVRIFGVTLLAVLEKPDAPNAVRK